MGYAELKHHSRQECPDQGRDSYVPPPGDPAPCYLNEKTCTSFYNSTGMGRSINITYDWKHFAYEDYDRWLYNRQASQHSALRASAGPCAVVPRCAAAAQCAAAWMPAHQHLQIKIHHEAADTMRRLCHAIRAGLRGCRWTHEKSGPTFLFVSPGLHDCYHQPGQYEHHARALRRLVEHLSMLRQTVVRILSLQSL